MALRETKREATRRRILAAARLLFLQQGYAATTMEQVAAGAEVSRASLFNYFPGKTALLEGLGHDLEARILEALNHYRVKHDSPSQVLMALFTHAAQVLEQTSGLTRLIFVHATGVVGLPSVEAGFLALVEKGQSSGHWRSDIAAPRLAELCYLEFVAGMLDWCRPEGQLHGDLFGDRVQALNTLLVA